MTGVLVGMQRWISCLVGITGQVLQRWLPEQGVQMQKTVHNDLLQQGWLKLLPDILMALCDVFLSQYGSERIVRNVVEQFDYWIVESFFDIVYK